MSKLTEDKLRKIVNNELQLVSEQIDHEGAKKVVTAASKLLKAVLAFKDDANAQMNAAVLSHLEPTIQSLENMINAPISYVDKQQKVVKKVVKLRRVEG